MATGNKQTVKAWGEKFHTLSRGFNVILLKLQQLPVNLKVHAANLNQIRLWTVAFMSFIQTVSELLIHLQSFLRMTHRKISCYSVIYLSRTNYILQQLQRRQTFPQEKSHLTVFITTSWGGRCKCVKTSVRNLIKSIHLLVLVMWNPIIF